MAAVADIPKQRNIELVCNYPQTASTLFPFWYGDVNNTGENHTSYDDINSKFIFFEKKFKEEYIKNEAIDEEAAKYRYLQTISTLLEIKPDVFTVEFTKESSIFITIKSGSFTFFLQQYFDFKGDFENDEEAFLSIFKDKKRLPSYAGSIKEVLLELTPLISNF